ncbi:L,D-carboxypeptidase A [compost metagenome]
MPRATEYTGLAGFKIITSKRNLTGIPIVADLDFGHTTPQLTLPIGGVIKMEVARSQIELSVISH